MKLNMFLYSAFIFINFMFFPTQSSSHGSDRVVKPPTYLQKQTAWVEKRLSEMTTEEKIGQLFMIAVYSNKNEADYRRIEEQIIRYHLGGVAFFQGNAIKQAELTNRYQAAATVPLLVGLDAEWGLGMRLNNTISFPKAITIGATQNAKLAEEVGYEIAMQCKRIGVNINFAPVADINSNPQNPVINYRSFGESVPNVSNLATAYARGHRKAGVMSSAKHFPGHGDTNVDSHRALPTLKHTLQHINEIEVAPFKQMIKDSVGSIMIGHLNVPALDNGMPASVSEKIVTQYLQGELGYQGLIITDALNMNGLLRSFPTGEAEVMAFKAGNDILLQTANIDKGYNAVLSAFIEGRITEVELDNRVRKILKAKFWAGLSEYKPVSLKNIEEDIHTERSEELIQLVFNESITVAKDNFGLVPLKGISQIKTASIAVGASKENLFQSMLNLYGNINTYLIEDKPARRSDWEAVVNEAAKSDLVIVSVHNIRHSEKLDYGITAETLNLLREVQKKSRLIVCVFGNPYSLKFFDDFETVVCGYEDENAAYMAMANVLYGVNPISGNIPVNTLAADAKLGDGYKFESYNRLGYGLPSIVGVNSSILKQIRPLVQNAIANKEFPGCQVLVARKGKVVYYEAFGNLEYSYGEPVSLHTIYDLASVTKVASTVQAMMMLYDQKLVDINKPISFYLPELLFTNKQDLTIKDILLHQSGLRSFMPLYEQTKMDHQSLNPYYFSMTPKNSDYTEIAENMYVNPALKDSVYSWIAGSSLIDSPDKRYVYSDLGLMLLQRLVERITGRSMDNYLGKNLYDPMGLNSLMFNVYQRKSLSLVAPTEVSGDFRKSAIRGTVHDPNAALLGGVAGHAGLFSNAWDLAKLMQMDLNKGTYDDHTFFSKETIDYFTSRQSKISDRGLGWNKPGEARGSVSEFASDQTYGHTGFTGTCVWVDPKEELIYVFLSNRVYPSASNKKLIQNKTRQKIHDIIYKSIIPAS